MSPIQLAAACASLAISLAALASDGQEPIYVSTFACDKGVLALDIDRSLSGIRRLGSIVEERIENVQSDRTETRMFKFDGLSLRALFPAGNHNESNSSA